MRRVAPDFLVAMADSSTSLGLLVARDVWQRYRLLAEPDHDSHVPPLCPWPAGSRRTRQDETGSFKPETFNRFVKSWLVDELVEGDARDERASCRQPPVEDRIGLSHLLGRLPDLGDGKDRVLFGPVTPSAQSATSARSSVVQAGPPGADRSSAPHRWNRRSS